MTYMHQLLSVVVENFNVHKVPYFLKAGTLLGAFMTRPPGMLRWDDDVDLGVRDADYDRMHQILSNDTRLVYTWNDAWGGFKYGLANYSSFYPYGQYNIDIFRQAYMSYGGKKHWYGYNRAKKTVVSRPNCYFKDSEINETVPCVFWDLTLTCPKYSMSYLSRCFGSLSTVRTDISHFAETAHNIRLENEDLNDHTAFLPALNKPLRDKLLPNTNVDTELTLDTSSGAEPDGP